MVIIIKSLNLCSKNALGGESSRSQRVKNATSSGLNGTSRVKMTDYQYTVRIATSSKSTIIWRITCESQTRKIYF